MLLSSIFRYSFPPPPRASPFILADDHYVTILLTKEEVMVRYAEIDALPSRAEFIKLGKLQTGNEE